MESEERTETLVKVAAMICLTVIVVASIAGLTVTAVVTDRDLFNAELFTFVLALCVGLLGGLSIFSFRRRHRWRVERESLVGGGG